MVDVTFLPEPVFPASGRLAVFGVDPATDLAAAASRLGLPAGHAAEARLAVPHDGRLVARDVGVRVIALDQALPALLSPVHAGAGWRHSADQRPDSLTCWQLAARLAVALVVGHRLVPRLVHAGEGRVHGVWHALPDQDAEEAATLARLAVALPVAAHAVVRDGERLWPSGELLAAFLDAVADHAARRRAASARPGRPRDRLLPWTARWAEALADPKDPIVPLRDDADELVAATAAWLATAGADDGAGTTELALHPPDDDASWRLTFAVRTAEGALVDAASVWRDADGLQDVLLRGLGRGARVFPPLDVALSQPAPEGADLDLDDAWLLLRDALPLLELAGVRVRLPFELVDGALHARLRLGVEAPQEPDVASTGDRESDAPGGGTLRGLLTGFRWEVALGDETLTAEEFAELVAAQAPLVRWRDRWVRVDPDEAARLRDLGGVGQLPLAQALALALEGRAPTPSGAHDADVVAEGAVADLVQRVHDAADRPPVGPSPPGFCGELRPYQQRGVAWLRGMGELGLGAVLADDMGLGKTVQLTAYLLARRDGPALVVCPTSVVGNWERELARFAPGLPVLRHHGPQRRTTLHAPKGVVVTSYGTLRRDVDLLAGIDWDVVALDEAQQVKNPQTAGARAVRRLRAGHVVALTGTPLENRLSELWSLLDATNPGLLGSQAAFARRFVAPIEQRRDASAAARLRRLVAPFVLRREKRDPAVIADLPPKIERTVVCVLTPEQAALYQAAVEQALARTAGQAGMQRRGRILALLTALKQICNHPAQYLKEPPSGEEGAQQGRSGKLATARELVGEAVGGGEQVLVFTQYVAMGHLLAGQFGADLGAHVPFLHGGVPGTARDRMVAAFQGEDPDTEPPPVLVVSLRAGGMGLNLSAATQVIHYDRWWNPAVEDQATDRAHRIGQTRTVEVHKLVTAGTVEERVAELLERKRALTDAVVGAGETWITELDDAALAELVALAADAPVTELDDEEEAA